MNVAQLRQQLEKKSTFEHALNSLTSEVVSHARAPIDAEVWRAVNRCHALLKARYTAINFWKLGLRFYQACQSLELDSKQSATLQQYIKEVGSFLNELDVDAHTEPDQVTRAGLAVEGQPNTSPALDLQRMLMDMYSTQARSRPSHLSDAGLILDDNPPPSYQPLFAHLAALTSATTTDSTDNTNARNTMTDTEQQHGSQQTRHRARAQDRQDGNEQNQQSRNQQNPQNLQNPQHQQNSQHQLNQQNQQSGSQQSEQSGSQLTEQGTRQQIQGAGDTSRDADLRGSGSGGQRRTLQLSEEQTALQRSILQGIQAVYSGMEAVARGTEAVEAELDNLLLSFVGQGEEAANTGPPPASKKLVDSLPRLEITDEVLERWGRDSHCPVCTEQLSVGDVVVQLPCSHNFHPNCVKPWLNQHNSCPTCRHQLPTDDPVYEARKEREAEEAEAQRGAQNALSHNEFMYI